MFMCFYIKVEVLIWEMYIVINKIQLSDNNVFKAKYYPCTHHNGSSEILKNFEQRTSAFPNYELYQELHSYGGDDCFKLYKDGNILNTDFMPFTSQTFNSIEESVNRLVEIFEQMMKK